MKSYDDPPFLIIHGDKDGIALRDANVPSTLVIVKNGSHRLAGTDISPSAEEISDTIIAFLIENLQKDPTP